jgi:hypothetical protein
MKSALTSGLAALVLAACSPSAPQPPVEAAQVPLTPEEDVWQEFYTNVMSPEYFAGWYSHARKSELLKTYTSEEVERMKRELDERLVLGVDKGQELYNKLGSPKVTTWDDARPIINSYYPFNTCQISVEGPESSLDQRHPISPNNQTYK